MGRGGELTGPVNRSVSCESRSLVGASNTLYRWFLVARRRCLLEPHSMRDGPLVRDFVGVRRSTEPRSTDEIRASVRGQNEEKPPRENGRTHEADDHDAGFRRWSDAGKRRRIG